MATALCGVELVFAALFLFDLFPFDMFYAIPF